MLALAWVDSSKLPKLMIAKSYALLRMDITEQSRTTGGSYRYVAGHQANYDN
jgi:hypothetical protein